MSIASLADLELEPTIIDLIEKADNPKDLYVSVFSQDNEHPDLETIFDRYNVKFSYRTTTTQSARGAGFARYMTRTALDLSNYKYYLQIDSHMRFDPGWDTILINSYERLKPIWGNYLFSTYPPAYEYDGDKEILMNGPIPPCVELLRVKEFYKFEAKYTEYTGETLGQETGYFCAGFVFGYTSIFDTVQHDPLIYFNGEEQLMSLRYHQNDIKIVCPPYVPIYHDYEGVRRKRLWEVNPEKDSLQQLSKRRVLEFFADMIEGEFGITDRMKYTNFFYNFVRRFPSENAQLSTDDPMYSEWIEKYPHKAQN